jgi:Zn-dependent protease/predicted transcriptional regulator
VSCSPNRLMSPNGIQLGRLFGIRIALDWSLIVIFLLVTFNLGGALFPSWHPNWGPALTWTVAIAAACLFFVSILLHEIAHALVARAYNIPVRRITLFLFGGVADIEEEPSSPKGEALMAAVGPATSIALGIAFGILAGVLAQTPSDLADHPMLALSHMGPLATLLTWLGPINVLVGVFNLLPAFPLDGGRILRAILWATTHDLQRSTRWASGIGQTIGWLLMVTGIAMAFGVTVPIFGRGFVGGVWLMFIGWFLSSAAALSYRALLFRKVLEGVPVRRLMRQTLPSVIKDDLPVSALVDEFMRTAQDVMLTEGESIGIVTLKDVQKVPRAQWDTMTIAEIATPVEKLTAVSPHDDAYQAVRRLNREQLDSMPIVENGSIVGILRSQDVSRWLELQREQTSGPHKASRRPISV